MSLVGGTYLGDVRDRWIDLYYVVVVEGEVGFENWNLDLILNLDL